MSGAFEERLVDADLSLALRLRGFLRFRRRAGMGEMLDHKLIEMSDDRVQESRAVSAGPRTVPVAKPAPHSGDLGRNDVSGVKEPEIFVSYGEESNIVAVPVEVPTTPTAAAQ